jgi:hypothetical protein
VPRSPTIGLVWFCSALFAAACDPGAAPPSTEHTVNTTELDFLNLFRSECIDQRNAAWVRAKSNYRLIACWFPTSDDNCRLELDGSVSWDQRLVDSSVASIEFAWPQNPSKMGPPPTAMTCALKLKDQPSVDFQGVAKIMAREILGRENPTDVISSTYEGTKIDVWTWRGGTEGAPSLKLRKVHPAADTATWEICYAVFPHTAILKCTSI